MRFTRTPKMAQMAPGCFLDCAIDLSIPCFSAPFPLVSRDGPVRFSEGKKEMLHQR
jgi:hypothetical protein